MPQQEIRADIECIFHAIYSAQRALRSLVALRKVSLTALPRKESQTTDREATNRELGELKQLPAELCGKVDAMDALEDTQARWIRYILAEAHERAYSLHGDTLTEPVHNAQGHYVYYQRPVGSLQEFINRVTSQETQLDFWSLMVKPGQLDNAVRFLKQCCETALPMVKRQRGYFSFRNGLYVMADNHFHPYTDGRYRAADGSEPAAARYFDVDFDPEWLDCPVEQIELPGFEQVLNKQELSAEVKRFFYAFMGRWYYAIKAKDNWQVVPFFKGMAGTGKSTMFEVRLPVYSTGYGHQLRQGGYRLAGQ